MLDRITVLQFSPTGGTRRAALLIAQQIAERVEEIDALEAAGKIFVLRPADPVEIGRFEKDTDKLLALYNRGRREMRDHLDDLLDYLER